MLDDPAGFRVSVAELDRDVPFSSFPGIDRTFLSLVDVTLVVNGKRRPVPRLAPISFRGEDAVSLELVAGCGRAVNLMTARGRFAGELRPFSRAEWRRRGRDTAGLFVDLGDVLVEVRLMSKQGAACP